MLLNIIVTIRLTTNPDHQNKKSFYGLLNQFLIVQIIKTTLKYLQEYSEPLIYEFTFNHTGSLSGFYQEEWKAAQSIALGVGKNGSLIKRIDEDLVGFVWIWHERTVDLFLGSEQKESSFTSFLMKRHENFT